MNTRRALAIGVLQIGHPLGIYTTASAQLEQNRECPHGSWTLGILDGGGWGVGAVTTVGGRDCIAVACYMQRCIMLLEHNAQAEIKLQPTSKITIRFILLTSKFYFDTVSDSST